MEFKITDIRSKFSDDDSCLEWLKNKIYPNGIKCTVCVRITKHHKIAMRRCYACDKCRHQVFPTAGTIFHKSSIPLKIWFEIIQNITGSHGCVSPKTLSKKYGLTQITAQRIIQKIEKTLKESATYDSESQGAEKKRVSESSNDPKHNPSLDKHIDTQTLLTNDISLRQKDDPHVNTHEIQQKKDRTARLLKLQMLLWQHPQGITIKELADRCAINKRTTYRDLRALESDLEVPIWQEKDKRGIIEGYYLPPISFTPAEANNIFIAARLMQQISLTYDSNVISTLMKLNTVVSLPLRKQIRKTLEYMEKQPRDSRMAYNFDKLVQAWLSQHRVRITYQNLVDEEDPIERVIEPYFVEPSSAGGTSYVIAFCHLKKRVCAFAISYIIGNVVIEPDTFEIPDDFNAIDYISTAWGVYSERKEIETVVLHFKPNISRSILDIKLHASQKTEVQKDGSIIMTLKVRDTIQFFGWILAWRDKVEVLEPKTMRDEICQLAKYFLNKYQSQPQDGLIIVT
jgi:predicted DNA-binding transcriptional regulator YafY